MSKTGPKFTMGVEEEYLLVDKETRALVVDPPESLMKECEERCGSQVTSELLRSQIEIGTKVCNNVQEARRSAAAAQNHCRCGWQSRTGTHCGVDASVQ